MTYLSWFLIGASLGGLSIVWLIDLAGGGASPRWMVPCGFYGLAAGFIILFSNNWFRDVSVIYVIGFVLVLWFNMAIGLMTLGLCLLRALLWPIFIPTGWPAGTQLPMD